MLTCPKYEASECVKDGIVKGGCSVTRGARNPTSSTSAVLWESTDDGGSASRGVGG